MQVHDLVAHLIKLPWNAKVTVALPNDKDSLYPVEMVGIIPEGPFGIYKPNIVYLEISEESI